MLATDVAQPFIWAGAAALIAGVAWVLRKAGTAAVDDRIDPKLAPFYERLDVHLKNEEAERSASRREQADTNRRLGSIESALIGMQTQVNETHIQMWRELSRKLDRPDGPVR